MENVDSVKQLSAISENWNNLKDYQKELLVEISSILKEIGPVGCRVLLMQAERLEIGANRYPGDDFSKVERNWIKEALEESLDRDVYTTVALLKLKDSVGEGD